MTETRLQRARRERSERIRATVNYAAIERAERQIDIQHVRDTAPHRHRHGQPCHVDYNRAAALQAKGLTYRQIALRLGVPHVSVKWTLSSACRKREAA